MRELDQVFVSGLHEAANESIFNVLGILKESMEDLICFVELESAPLDTFQVAEYAGLLLIYRRVDGCGVDLLLE